MKKKFILLIVCMMFAMGLSAHDFFVDNKGNINQTYPEVTEVNPEIYAMVTQVDTMNLYNYIAWMQQYIRDAVSEEALLTQNWLVEQYESMGLEAYMHYFCMDELGPDVLDAGNVIAVQPGTEFPDEYVIISSHYDHGDGPGADDNASGTAGVLECARILSQYSFKRSILYINFNAEESGRYGSLYLAQKYAEENKDILGMFNLDMIGYWPPEMDSVAMYASNVHLSMNLFDYYTNVANMYNPDIPTKVLADNWHSGDDMCFRIFDYPALYIGDVEHLYIHPCYHEPCDTIGHGVNNFELVKSFTQSALAATAELADGWLPPQDFSAIPVDDRLHLSWESAEDAASYKLFRDGELIAEVSDNQYDDYDIERDVKYEYFVKAVKSDGKESGESNHDIMRLSNLIELPYVENFEDNLDDFHFNSPFWQLLDQPYSGNYALTNEVESAQHSSHSSAELYGFSIPDTVQNVKLSFQCKCNKNYFSTSFVYVEVSKDRKTWHKLHKVGRFNGKWHLIELSLNDYIGEPFVQIRFRIEDTTEEVMWPVQPIIHSILIDELKLEFAPLLNVEEVEYEPFSELCVSPNPANSYIEISTDLKDSYSVTIYNIEGIKVLREDYFVNGKLDISSLSPGIYFVTVNHKGDCMSKRIVIK